MVVCPFIRLTVVIILGFGEIRFECWYPIINLNSLNIMNMTVRTCDMGIPWFCMVAVCEELTF
jgi:hypothetical protein